MGSVRLEGRIVEKGGEQRLARITWVGKRGLSDGRAKGKGKTRACGTE